MSIELIGTEIVEENMSRYMNFLKKTISARKTHKIENLDSIYEKLKRCPASTKYHGSKPGGLVEHLLNVGELAANIVNSILFTVEELNLLMPKIVFCALVHDLGKLGNLEQDFYLINPDEKKRDKEPYIVNTELVSMPHELRTFYWLNYLGITDLTEDEYQAINFHAGPYTLGYLDMVRKESPLLVLLHSADNLSTKIIER